MGKELRGKKAREAAKRAAGKNLGKNNQDKKSDSDEENSQGSGSDVEVQKGTEKNDHLGVITSDDITATGVLASHYDSRDIKIDNFTLTFHGAELITDCSLELNYGNRYGLIGPNGSGKSTLLTCLALREVPIPDWIDVYILQEEVAPGEETALQTVIADVKKEVARLEDEQMKLMAEAPDSERLSFIMERLDDLDPNLFEKRAGELLFGLGFEKDMIHKKTKDMSGGWRMRVALAKALFIQPMLLLLDEPTNHLDMECTIWLEDYLKKYPCILVLISHSQDFLNSVCTHTISIQDRRPIVYGGNYDTYVKTRAELEINQMKHYKKQQEEIKHHKDFIASCGTYANLVRQAKSRQKILDKMEADGLFKEVVKEPTWGFSFHDCNKLPPPVLSFEKVSFAYPNCAPVYTDVSFGMDLDSRVALVGPNGAGKSTLLKLLNGDLSATYGQIKRHSHLRFSRYHQHSHELLPPAKSCLDFTRDRFPEGPDGKGKIDMEQWRSVIGRYGITGRNQLCPMANLSEGQKSRIVFMIMVLENPNFLLLDEPTNHLDIQAIDALADAIKKFNGGMVLVSHDFRLINAVAQEIWVCDHRCITKYKGSIQDYKNELRKELKTKQALEASK